MFTGTKILLCCSLSGIKQRDVLYKKSFVDYQYEYFRHINLGLYGSLEVCMKVDLKHICKLCLSMSFRVTKMAMVGSAELGLCYVRPRTDLSILASRTA